MKTLFMILMFALVAGGASEVGKCDKINGQYATCCGPYGC